MLKRLPLLAAIAGAETPASAQTFTAFVTPSVAPSKAPVPAGGFRCMNRGSTPSYSWTNFDVAWRAGALTVTIDDGNEASPAFRDFCWNMDPSNDETVSIYYTRLGGRALAGAAEGAAGAVAAPGARDAQAIGQWLNEFMCPVIRGGSTLPPALDESLAYTIAPGSSCWDSPPWSPVGGMYDSRATYLVHFKPASAAAPLFTCCQPSGSTPCPAAYVRCGGVWSASLPAVGAPGVSASATPAPAGASASSTPSAAMAAVSASSTPSAAAAAATATGSDSPAPTPSGTPSTTPSVAAAVAASATGSDSPTPTPTPSPAVTPSATPAAAAAASSTPSASSTPPPGGAASVTPAASVDRAPGETAASATPSSARSASPASSAASPENLGVSAGVAAPAAAGNDSIAKAVAGLAGAIALTAAAAFAAYIHHSRRAARLSKAGAPAAALADDGFPVTMGSAAGASVTTNPLANVAGASASRARADARADEL